MKPIACRLSLGRAFGLLALASHVMSSVASPGAHGPNGEHLDAPTVNVRNGLGRLPDGSVSVPMAAQRRMGIRTVMPSPTEAAASVELAGRVLMDPAAGGLVQPAQGGRIEPGPRGLPVAGQAVRRGEVLAWVRFQAEPYAQAGQRAQLAELRAARQLAEQRVQRLSGLEGSVPRKEIEAARAEAESLAAREHSIAGSLDAREALRAPLDGVIARAEAAHGQVVAAGTTLFEVVDPARVVVEAVTADAALPGRVASAQLQGLPQLSLQWLGASRSLRDGMIPLSFRARAAADAPLPLAVGQPVTVIAALSDKVRGFVLPAEALVRNTANEPVVWIKAGAERYVAQPVQARALDATRVVVTQGLGEGNRVVVQGAALLAQIR
ncbi:efflux RND transporter periplasmic adaptor subunit [Caldimonas sp. KR1-144]|uniref:efflux RND transporter periplasmic adaptor subunit n=1 Tax=Caldimonas sp. KR1-144 TaxID=3400911 RepID=UPI003C119E37